MQRTETAVEVVRDLYRYFRNINPAATKALRKKTYRFALACHAEKPRLKR